MDIFKIFKRKKIVESIKNDLTILPEKSEPIKSKILGQDYSYCHYCGKNFDVEKKKILIVDVPHCEGSYFYSGKGYLCPHCNKTVIIG